MFWYDIWQSLVRLQKDVSLNLLPNFSDGCRICLEKSKRTCRKSAPVKVQNNNEKLVRRVEPTKQYIKSQNKYAPETKQLKIKGVKYPN